MKDIECMVRECSVCQEHQRSQSAQPLVPHEVPQRPWEVIGTDIFIIDGVDYLLVADYFSKVPFVRRIRGSTTSTSVISLMKQIFREQGIPRKVISDNGPQYAAADFKEFTTEWDFEHATSSPRYPQSNGFAERMVQTMKNTITKARKSDIDPDLALLRLITTPVDSNISTPAELLHGHRLKDNMPTISSENPMQADTRRKLINKQAKQRYAHDRKATRDLPQLNVGQRVLHQDQDSGRWSPAIVTGVAEEPRSYVIETPNGSSIRRNRRHLHLLMPPKRVTFAEPVSNGQDSADSGRQETPGSSSTHSGRITRKPQRLVEDENWH